MATVNDILIEVYRRTRDPDRVATEETIGIHFVSLAHQLVNVYTKSTLVTVPFLLQPQRLFYQISQEVPDCVRMEAVRYLQRDMTEVPWSSLWQLGQTWFRATGTTPQHWAKCGRDLFIVYPAPLTQLAVDLVYTPLLDELTALTDLINLRNEFFPLLIDLVEALFLLRLRYFSAGNQAGAEPFDVVLGRLQAHMGMK